MRICGCCRRKAQILLLHTDYFLKKKIVFLEIESLINRLFYVVVLTAFNRTIEELKWHETHKIGLVLFLLIAP